MKRRLLLVSFGLSMTLATAAHAEPTAADRETARTLLDQGDALFASGDRAEALRRYQQADDIMHVPTTALSVERAQASLGLLLEAKESCRRVLTFPQSAAEPAPFAAARQKCESEIQSLSARIPMLSVRFYGLGPDERPNVTINGEKVVADGAGVVRKLNPGKHKLVAEAPGRAPQERAFELAEQQALELQIAFGTATEGAAPTAPPAVEPRTDVTATGRAPVPTYAKIAGATGAVALVGGAIAGGLSLGALSDAKQYCNGDVCSERARADLDSTRRLELVANISFGVAIIAGAIGVYGYLSRGSAPNASNATARWAPFVGPSGSGAAVRF
jgi:hypothetical protein